MKSVETDPDIKSMGRDPEVKTVGRLGGLRCIPTAQIEKGGVPKTGNFLIGNYQKKRVIT